MTDQTHWPGPENLNISPQTEAFIDYSTIYWADHVGSSYNLEKHMSKVILSQLKKFLGSPAVPSEAYRNWIQQVKFIRRRPGSATLAYLESTPLNSFFALSYFPFGKELREQWECNLFDIDCMNNHGETLLFVASICGNEGVVKILLAKGADANAGRYTRSPLIAAVQGGHVRVVVQLLDKGAYVYSLENVLEAATNEGAQEIIAAVMDRNPNIGVAPKDVITVARKFDDRVMGMLVARGPNFEITEAIVAAAAGNWRMGDLIIKKVLLARDRSLRISQQAVTAIVQKFDHTVMEMLLARGPNFEITEAIVAAAAEKREMGDQVMKMMLAGGSNLRISREAVAAVVRKFDYKVVEALLARDPKPEITEAIMVAAAGNLRVGEGVVRFLLARDPNIEVTKAIVMAAAGNRVTGQQVMWILLAGDPNIELTEAITMTTVGNRRTGEQEVKVMRARARSPRFTPEAVVAVVCEFDCAVMEALLDRDPNFEITEAIMVAAAGNRKLDERAMEILLARDPNFKIIEAVVVAAGLNWRFGKRVMKAMLAWGSSLRITPEAVAAVVRRFGCEVVEMLLARDPSFEITEAIVTATAGLDLRLGEQTMKKILAGGDSLSITPEAVAAIVRRFGCEVVEMLLARDPNFEITEAVVKAAASNWEMGEKVMKTMLAGGRSLGITQGAVAAVRQLFDRRVVEALLARPHNSEITKTTPAVGGEGWED